MSNITEKHGNVKFLNRKVSFVRDVWHTEDLEEITVSEFLHYVQTGRYRDRIEKLRAITDHKVYNDEKEKLPAILLSALFSTRSGKVPLEEKLIAHSGLLQIDIDHVHDLPAMRAKVDADQYTAFSFISPGGNGLKIGIRINPTRHEESRESAATYYLREYGVTIDPKVTEVARLLFVSWDPDLFINPDAKLFPVTKAARPDPVAARVVEDPLSIPDQQRRHGERALETAKKVIEQAKDGAKLNDLLKAGNLLGGYVAGGMLTRGEAVNALRSAIDRKPNVNSQKTAYKAIDDAIEHGMSDPVSFDALEKERKEYCERMGFIPPDPPPYFDEIPFSTGGGKQNEQNEQNEQTEQTQEYSAEMSIDEQVMSRMSRESGGNGRKFVGNLAGCIEDWIDNSIGYFSTADLDREFGLTLRDDRNRRSQVLYTLCKKRKILKDKTIAGRYQIVNAGVEWTTLTQVDEEPFPISLPLGLPNLVTIPNKSIVVFAGTSNAGKTALSLSLLKANFNSNFDMVYLFSEMGQQELRARVAAINNGDVAGWEQRIKSANVVSNFDQVISHHNPNGLTVVDYLEEIAGEYYRIPSALRDIYDALNDGVAVVNLQKKTGAMFAMGGEATTHKARLYLSLDMLCQTRNCSYAAVKILKAKCYPGSNNPNNLERHIKIIRGAEIVPVSEWIYCNEKQRESYAAYYQNK